MSRKAIEAWLAIRHAPPLRASAWLRPTNRCWRAMQAFTDARDPDTPDELWLLEHDPVFTLGQAGKPEHVLVRRRHSGDQGRSRRPGDLPRAGPDRWLSVDRPAPARHRRARIGRVASSRPSSTRLSTGTSSPCDATARPASSRPMPKSRRSGCACAAVARFTDWRSMWRWIWSRFSASIRADIEGLRVTQMLDLGGPGALSDVEDVLIAELARQFGLTSRSRPTRRNFRPCRPCVWPTRCRA